MCGLTASDVHASEACAVYTEALKSCLLALGGGQYGSVEDIQMALEVKKIELSDCA